MTKENQELYLQFLREISGGDGDMNKVTEALSGVAYYYHISAVEAEIVGDDDIDKKELTLFERENAEPVGEPIKFTIESGKNIAYVIYIYAEEKAFDGNEKEELEMYALSLSFILERYRLLYYLKQVIK